MRLSIAGLTVAAMLVQGSAYAQESAPAVASDQPAANEAKPEVNPASDAKKDDVEEILVTGSRIWRPDLSTAAPVTVMNKDEIAKSGKVSIGDILQTLPSQANAINTQYNNGGDGSTRVDLRGIGAARTLVLLNGRRHVSGGIGADDSVDLNSIPASAIERIEVLKDGASAIYGSDAVAGVVNIITKRDWSGTEASIFSGVSGRGDGLLLDMNVMTGQTTEKSSFLISAGYMRQQPVWSGDRDFSKVDYSYDWDTKEVTTTGSYATPEGLIIDVEGDPGNAEWQRVLETDGGASGMYSLQKDGWRPFNDSAVQGLGGDLYNYQPDNLLVTPQQRLHLFTTGSTKLFKNARGYFEASFTNRRSEQKLAPEPFWTDSEGITVSSQNVYNKFGRDFAVIGRRLSEFGNRYYGQDVDTFRLVGGLDGHLPEEFGIFNGWFWDTSLNIGRNSASEMKRGFLIRNRLAAALGPSYRDADGVAHCGTDAAHEIAGCVPLNLFGGAGSIDPNQKGWLSYEGSRRGFNQQISYLANTSGELPLTLYADRPLGMAVGYEYRRESGANIPETLTALGETTGNKEQATGGGYNVNEGYVELSIPVISGKKFIEDFELSAAARAFNYSTFGSDATYKIGARWKVIPDLTLRGTYSTAFRAPSINELYMGTTDSFEDVRDPCSTKGGRTLSASEAEQCAAEGVAANHVENNAQLRALWGGNPNLNPETAQIFTVGAVFEPTVLEGFSLTADYYSIAVKNAIAQVTADVILSSCYNPEEGQDRQYCDRIHRDQFGRIKAIDDPQTNVGGDTTAGIDVGARYEMGSRVGRWAFNVDFNWLQKFDREFAGGNVVEAKNTYDLGGVYSDLKGVAGVRWGLKNYGAGLTGRFVNGFKECEGNSCALDETGQAPNSRAVEPYATFDGFVSYDLESGYGKTNVALGVNNILDAKPAVVYNGFTASSDTSAYDYMGRYFYVRLAQAL